MHLFVGSQNLAKLNAVRQAVHHQWPDAKIVGYEVASGVAKQPMTDEETRQGAENRARTALEKGQAQFPKLKQGDALGVGLEGGVTPWHDQLWSTVWVAVVDVTGQVFFANGARFQLPRFVAEPVLAGKELGPALEEMVGIRDLRKKQGMIGLLTHDFTDRATEYGSIAKLAIGLWFGQDCRES